MAKVKGPAVIGARDWLDERFGSGSFLNLAREVDPAYPERVLPGDWYPLAPMLHALAHALERDDEYDSLERLVEVLAAGNAQKDLRGIYRAFLWVASPRMFLHAAPKIWATYSDIGTITEMDNEPGRFTVSVTQIPREYLEWLVGAWKGFLPPAIELAGGKNPIATVLERKPSGGSWGIRYQLTYE